MSSSTTSVSSRSSSNDSEFESAQEEDELNMGTDLDMFENSNNCGEGEGMEVDEQEEEEVAPRVDPKTSVSSSVKTNVPVISGGEDTTDSRKILMSKLPKGADLVAQQATGLLYVERYQSFVYKHWPYEVRSGHLCHPKALAMAGLGFYSLEPSPSAQCQVCLVVLKNLQPNSNPWILHSEASPDCLLIKWGQRQEVDDYTMDQLLEMAYKKILNVAEQKLREREQILRKQLRGLRELELKREREKQHASSNE